MSEAILGESIGVVGELSLELARQLGGEAVQASFLQEKIEAMSPAARINAINHLAGLVTSLETVKTEDTAHVTLAEPTIHLVETDPHSLTAVAEPTPDLAIDTNISEASELEPKPQAELASVSEVLGGEPLTKKPLNYLYSYFDMSLVDQLHQGHIGALAETIADTYCAEFPRGAKQKEKLVGELAAYLHGESDGEIAARFNRPTAAAAQMKRSQVFVALRKKLDTPQINAMLETALASVPKSKEQIVEKDEILPEVAESSTIERILAEHGVALAEKEEPRDLKDIVLEQAQQVWDGDKELLMSLEALLEQTDISPAQAEARQELKSLMQAFAPRWYPKLGIKQDSWNISSNIVGLQNPRVMSLAEAKSRYGGRLSLNKSSVENELLSMINFLFDKQISGAEPAPQARNVASQQSFLAQRPTRR